MGPGELTVAVLVGVTAVALLMKVFTRSDENAGDAPAAGRRTEREREGYGSVDALLEEASASAEVVAITSDGVAFVPDGDVVHLIPPGEPEDVFPVRSLMATGSEPSTDPGTGALLGRGAPVNPKTGHRLPGWSPGQRFDPGDLTGARVVRGAPDFDPWRLEALGRDREYLAWAFETEEAARAALALLERRTVRVPEDEDGNPRPPEAGEYLEARRRDEETEHELDSEEMPPPE